MLQNLGASNRTLGDDVEILELRLMSDRLDEIQAFYVNTLDLPLVQRDADHLIVQVGRTRLVSASSQSEYSDC